LSWSRNSAYPFANVLAHAQQASECPVNVETGQACWVRILDWRLFQVPVGALALERLAGLEKNYPVAPLHRLIAHQDDMSVSQRWQTLVQLEKQEGGGSARAKALPTDALRPRQLDRRNLNFCPGPEDPVAARDEAVAVDLCRRDKECVVEPMAMVTNNEVRQRLAS
jgi:hypothetical protein